MFTVCSRPNVPYASVTWRVAARYLVWDVGVGGRSWTGKKTKSRKSRKRRKRRKKGGDS